MIQNYVTLKCIFISEKGDLYLVQKKRGQDEPDEIFLIITSE
jgi:hypothetical protein